MIQAGQLVLFTFPKTDQDAGSLRPALVLRSLPRFHDDWRPRTYFQANVLPESKSLASAEFL